MHTNILPTDLAGPIFDLALPYTERIKKWKLRPLATMTPKDIKDDSHNENALHYQANPSAPKDLEDYS